MIAKVKNIFYFPVASYFRFFAMIRLKRWHPKVIVITGSSGKTTLLHLLESQIGSVAKYSHHANSSFGIPFDILGLARKSLFKTEWMSLFLKAPVHAIKGIPKEKLYIVEADCDRPGEGKFLASLLHPEIVVWVNVSRTHSMNFDSQVSKKLFMTVDEAISYEYGFFLEYCSEMAIINGDMPLIIKQLPRTKAESREIVKKDNLKKYEVLKNGTLFEIDNTKYTFQFLLPEEIFYGIEASKALIAKVGGEVDPMFANFILPPGRSSLFKGIKQTVLVDSSYNANLTSCSAVLNMYTKFSSQKKWLVLGDMLELGKEEKEEHEKLADIIASMKLDRIILMGPRISQYTYPKLKSLVGDTIIIEKFLTPREVLDYLLSAITGGETILFKGARFLEGVIEHLLLDKKDAEKLCRREKIWKIRRKQWGL